jgi:arginyl-tRNA--protein-N-Asp/Glu arginylyltransferase
MKIVCGEFAHDYARYAFGYTLHATSEPDEAITPIYEAGFLPASSDPTVHNQFYMARSIRVPLSAFSPTSENRRILKKYDGQFDIEQLSREALMQSEPFKDCFLSYFADRHGQSVMSRERLEGILNTELPLQGIRYSHNGTPAAYVLEVLEGDIAHYWFSCYDTRYAGSSLGMWLMLDAVRRAKDTDLSQLYLGTAYGEKGRYKMNISPLEFWNGTIWDTDLKRLKQLVTEDATRKES